MKKIRETKRRATKESGIISELRRRPDLPNLEAAEWAALERHLPTVIERATAWTSRLPISNPEVVLPVSVVSVVALANLLESEPILARAKGTLWIYALDDAIDDPEISEGALDRLVWECRSVIRGDGSPDLTSSLSRVLDSLIREFSSYPNFRLFELMWRHSLLDVIEGMLYERRISIGLNKAESYSQAGYSSYLNYAMRSISLAHILVASLFVDSDPRNAWYQQRFNEVALPCSKAMRLANDIAGAERERKSGKVNAVWIIAEALVREGRAQTYEEGALSAKALLHQQIQSELNTAKLLVSALKSETGAERRIYRATECGIEMYLYQDYRQWSGKNDTDSRIEQP